MKFSDLVIGIVLVIAGVAILLEARTFPAVPGQRFGASFFPSVVGGALALAGLALALMAVFTKRVKPIANKPEWMSSPRRVASFVLVIVAVIFFILASQTIGFILTTFIVLTGLQVWLGFRTVPAILVAIGGSFGFYAIFSLLLRVPLQRGLIERLIF